MTHSPTDVRSEAPSSPEAGKVPQILVNGERRPPPAGGTLAALVIELGLDGRKIAVAVNREVVPRSGRDDFALSDGDHVEILEAVGGG